MNIVVYILNLLVTIGIIYLFLKDYDAEGSYGFFFILLIQSLLNLMFAGGMYFFRKDLAKPFLYSALAVVALFLIIIALVAI